MQNGGHESEALHAAKLANSTAVSVSPLQSTIQAWLEELSTSGCCGQPWPVHSILIVSLLHAGELVKEGTFCGCRKCHSRVIHGSKSEVYANEEEAGLRGRRISVRHSFIDPPTCQGLP